MSGNETQESDCPILGPNDVAILIGVHTVTSMVSLCSGIIVIFLIIVLKKYLFFSQRMILYLNVICVMVSIVSCINVATDDSEDEHSPMFEYCKALGFLNQYAISCFMVAITCFTVNIFLQATCHYNTQRIEVVYVLLIFILPALYSWIPLKFDAYGVAGIWCWIRAREYMHENNSNMCMVFKTGAYLRIGLFYLPVFIIYPLLFFLLILTLCVTYRRRHEYMATIDVHAKKKRSAIISEVRSLLWYPIIVIVVDLVPFMTRIYEIVHPETELSVLWTLNALIVPLEGFAVAAIFIANHDTRKSLRWAKLRSAFLHMCMAKKDVEEYPTGIVSSDSKHDTSIANESLVSDYYDYK